MLDQEWLLDSWASEHMNGDATAFTKHRGTPGMFIMQAEKFKQDVKGDDSLELNLEQPEGVVETVAPHKVAFIPSMGLIQISTSTAVGNYKGKNCDSEVIC